VAPIFPPTLNLGLISRLGVCNPCAPPLAHGWLGRDEGRGTGRRPRAGARSVILHALDVLTLSIVRRGSVLLLATAVVNLLANVRYFGFVNRGCVLMLGGGCIGNVWASRCDIFGGLCVC